MDLNIVYFLKRKEKRHFFDDSWRKSLNIVILTLTPVSAVLTDGHFGNQDIRLNCGQSLYVFAVYTYTQTMPHVNVRIQKHCIAMFYLHKNLIPDSESNRKNVQTLLRCKLVDERGKIWYTFLTRIVSYIRNTSRGCPHCWAKINLVWGLTLQGPGHRLCFGPWGGPPGSGGPKQGLESIYSCNRLQLLFYEIFA
jgi:hypothetical protein